MKMLAGLISLCSTLPPLPRSSGTRLWQQSRASSSWQHIFQMTSSSIQFIICLDFFNYDPKSPRAQNSIMMQTFEFTLSTTRSTQRTMLGCYNSFRRFTSVTSCCFSRLLIFQKVIYFHTRVSPLCLDFTFRTTPKEPLPIYQSGMYLSIFLNFNNCQLRDIYMRGWRFQGAHHLNNGVSLLCDKIDIIFVSFGGNYLPPSSIYKSIDIYKLNQAAIDLIIYKQMLIIATLLYYPLKIFIFLIYPVGLIIKALQFQTQRNEQEESNRKKKLLLLAFLFIAYSIVEKLFGNFDSKFFLLLFMMGGAIFAKEKGYFDQAVEKISQVANKKSQ